MAFEFLLDPVLGPLVELGPLWTIAILSFFISLLITVVYKFATDQDEMKRLKTKMKEHQKKIRKLQKKDPEKALKMQQDAMQDNLKYMKHSFKPTLYTFIPLIIIFGWMNANLAYHAIDPGQQFTVTAEMLPGLPGNVSLSSVPSLDIEQPVKKASEHVSWGVSGREGEYRLLVKYGESQFGKDVLITDGYKYSSPSEEFDGSVREISLGMKKVKPFGFSILGWEPGWLGTYILLSIVFSMVLRKAMSIY